jgi:hypothetical protein
LVLILSELVGSIADFDTWTTQQRIAFTCWFLQREERWSYIQKWRLQQWLEEGDRQRLVNVYVHEVDGGGFFTHLVRAKRLERVGHGRYRVARGWRTALEAEYGRTLDGLKARR